MKRSMKIAGTPFLAGLLAAVVTPQMLAGQGDVPHRIVLRQHDGSQVILSSGAVEVDGDPCIPVADLAVAMHGTTDLAPSLRLEGSTLRASPAETPTRGSVVVKRSGTISNQVLEMRDFDGRRQLCVTAADLARSMGGKLKRVEIPGWLGMAYAVEGVASVEQFDSQINSMMNNNMVFLALQTKVQQVSQTTQMTSNIAKADSDAKLSAVRNMRAAVFDETESVLALAPANQVAWARSYASGAGRSASTAEIQAAIRAAFPNDPPGMRVQTHLILQLIMMGDVVGALRSYTTPMDRDVRESSQALIEKLDEVAEARARVIRNFAQRKPPRAYAGQDPQAAARAQDRAQRYTQFVQLSTQLMGELQTSERELVDVLPTMKRDLDNLWQSYASMRDNDFRTSERIMQIR